jgi:hypothetical protein
MSLIASRCSRPIRKWEKKQRDLSEDAVAAPNKADRCIWFDTAHVLGACGSIRWPCIDVSAYSLSLIIRCSRLERGIRRREG